MHTSFRRFSLFLLALAVTASAACSKLSDRSDGASGANGASTESSYQEKVNAKLQRERLITIPEVQQMSQQFVEQYRSGQTTRDQAAKAFYEWILQYEKAHPEQVAAAKKGLAVK